MPKTKAGLQEIMNSPSLGRLPHHRQKYNRCATSRKSRWLTNIVQGGYWLSDTSMPVEVPCAAADAFLHLCAVHAFEIDDAVEHRGDAALVGFRRRAAPSERPRRFKSQADPAVRIAQKNTRTAKASSDSVAASYLASLPRCRTGGCCWNILG